MILAPQYGPHISKVQFSAVSVFWLDSSNLPILATNGVYVHMAKFWRTLAFGLATYNEWSTRIPIATCNIWSAWDLEKFSKKNQPLATNGFPGTQQIFKNFFGQLMFKIRFRKFPTIFVGKFFPPKLTNTCENFKGKIYGLRKIRVL